MSDESTPVPEVLEHRKLDGGTRLHLIVTLAHRTDYRGGKFKVKPEEKLGPMTGTRDACEEFAAFIIARHFPARAGWEQQRYLVCAVPDDVVTAAAFHLGCLTPLQVEQKLAAARAEAFREGREQGLRDAKQRAKEERKLARKSGRREFTEELA